MGEGNIFSSLGLIFFFYHKEKILCPNKMGRGGGSKGKHFRSLGIIFYNTKGRDDWVSFFPCHVDLIFFYLGNRKFDSMPETDFTEN